MSLTTIRLGSENIWSQQSKYLDHCNLFGIFQTLASAALKISGEVVVLDIIAEVLIDIREEALVEMVKTKVVEVQLRLSDSFLP